MKLLKQLLCPIRGTMYLIGGYEYGHRWRYNDGENYIYCKDCGKEIHFLIYAKENK
jgi:hypothetical protein